MMFSNLTLPRLCSLSAIAFLMAVLSACETTDSSRHSDYASNFPADGTYNPYPDGGGGHVDSHSHTTHSAQYGQPVPPPPAGFKGPDHEDTPRKTTASASSTTKKAPAKATSSGTSKATASKSSTTQKKPTNVANKSDDAPAKPKATASSTPKKSSGGGGVHIVVKGDNLWSLARKNDTTVAKLMALNGLSSDKLKLGQKIKLP
jgi:LysM repeat protein